MRGAIEYILVGNQKTRGPVIQMFHPHACNCSPVLCPHTHALESLVLIIGAVQTVTVTPRR
jgi:hypothetical protein